MDFSGFFAKLIALLWGLTCFSNGDPFVTLDGGSVRGSEMISDNENVFLAFRGIPYAEPPIGKLRFKPPVPKKPWGNKPLDATADGPECPQRHPFTHEYVGQEDNCLVLNVYTNQINTNRKKPVMVFIHGGGFENGAGTSKQHGPKRLIDMDIVLVTINYRLGILGFLSTGDSASPGNYGMLDQVEALKWVKTNIEQFGGDPETVTIFGESAGSASVHYHMLSPLSKGLFHRAIAESGTVLDIYAFQPDPLIWGQKVGVVLRCPVTDTEKLVECLRYAPEKNITQVANSKTGILPLLFVPNVDGHFLLDTPLNLLREGKVNQDVPFMNGVNQEEGAFGYAVFTMLMLVTKSEMSKKFMKFQVRDLLGTFLYNEKAVNLVFDEYLANVDFSDQPTLQKAIIDMYSEGAFEKTHALAVRLMAEAGVETYAYSYDFAAPFSQTQLFGIPETFGVGHGDELFMLFDGDAFKAFTPTDKVKIVKKTFQTLLTNFAKYGNPTPDDHSDSLPKWTPVSTKEINVYHIDDPVNTDVYDPAADEKYAFWTEKVPEALKDSKPSRTVMRNEEL